MPLNKQPIPINFSQGLETKVDPFQVQVGKFLSLQNSVFDKVGRLTKRNGFSNITTLPTTAVATTLTTLNNNLIATGSSLYAYSNTTSQWLNQGNIQPIKLGVQPLVRVSTSQSSPDAAISSAGLTCLVYVDNSVAYYQVSDSATGQQIVSRTALPTTATNPRAYILGQYFVITFMATVSGAPHMRYIAIPVSLPTAPLAAADISSSNPNAITDGYDAYVANNNLYVAWNSSSGIKIAYLTSTLVGSPTATITGHSCALMSVTADTSGGSTPIIWLSWYETGANTYTACFNQQLIPIRTATPIATAVVINEITSVATAGLCTVIYENNNTYGYAPNAKTDFLSKVTIPQVGSVGGTSVILRSVGLGSKAFIDTTGKIYVIASYGQANQPTYFLIDSSGAIYMRLAYANGGGYEASQVLPTVSYVQGQYLFPYLIKDFLATVNKSALQNPATVANNAPLNAIYTQTGINLASFAINVSSQYSSEIAGALHLTGGQLWEYDGVRPVEHGFQVWPEDIAATTATTGGNLAATTYYYAFTYEWTDNQGNLHRSAPSIPLAVTTTGATSTNTVYVPTLRLTYKIAPNPVRIVGYRWSTLQQVYYQFTSITSPIINDPTADYVTIVDTQADSSILGQTILYTSGGVVEDIAAPASIASALFKNRLFLIDAEDQNLLWFSKQVIEAVPVEMSDLLTLYVAPTSGAQGSTGPMTALGAMDDKLIIFKRNAIYYITGTGPDNTGANNDFSDPIFVTSSVGCTNPNSIVLMPNGLMFQSDKGIWLLGRDLSTTYIGAPVEQYNGQTIRSAQAIPGVNQVRFLLNNTTLMYDYFMQQWGTFTNTSAISSTLFNNAHTYLNTLGLVYQETPGVFTDGSSPVLMSFTTSWINVAGVQGYERFYQALLLGTYFTPFTLNVTLGYDYNSSPSQNISVKPDNFATSWGSESNWGAGSQWGGSGGNIFEARLFPAKQKCESFQLSINEIYDNSFGVPPGQGLSLSGLELLVGIKKGSRTQGSGRSFG